MSCMEHECVNINCGWFAMDNKHWNRCPKCGGKIVSVFDEQFDHCPKESE